MTRLTELSPALKQTELYFIGHGDENDLSTLRPALIDGKKNSTGNDIVLLFSSPDKAGHYRSRYPSLAGLDIYQATIAEVIAILDGKVEHFIVDRC